VADALPVDVAMKLGCTDILVILNQPVQGYHFDRFHRRLQRHLVKVFAKNKPEAIKSILPTNEALLQQNIRLITMPNKEARIFMLEPSDLQMLVSMGSIDKPKIQQLAKLGIVDMELFLNKQLQA
jgi:predicted patatin/cPLA2 family phospholipase